MPYSQLKKQELVNALRRLGELAQNEQVQIEISLYGGAVFTLVYGSRDSTKDVDAIIRPSSIAQKLAGQVAKEQNLSEDWINDSVRQFLPATGAMRPFDDLNLGAGIRLSVPTAAYLLALKLNACRQPVSGYAGDIDDIAFLLRKMNIETVDAADAVFQRFFPEDALPEPTRATLSRLLKEQQATDTPIEPQPASRGAAGR